MSNDLPVAVTCYDVFTKAEMEFIGRMPMKTLRQFYGLHKSAEERVLRESSTPEGCALHFNRSDKKDILVRLVPTSWFSMWWDRSLPVDKVG